MLSVDGLSVAFAKGCYVVRNLSFQVECGEVLGIVGESGSGKSMTALALAGLLPSGALAAGRISFLGELLRPGFSRDWHELRGRKIGMVFQDPSSCLNPLMPVGRQVAETLQLHRQLSKKDAEKGTVRWFEAMGIRPARQRIMQYPHQLSGGLRQRVMLAIAMCCAPPLIIADEPTTALDVTVQAQILQLLRMYVDGHTAGLILISHDLGVIAQLADRVLVMCDGIIVEAAPVWELYANPLHPYTRLMLESVPRLDRPLPPVASFFEEEQVTAACPFFSRCRQKMSVCLAVVPEPATISPARIVRCHLY